MPGHGNFTSVTLGPDGDADVRKVHADVLKINGESSGDIDLVQVIVVAIESADIAKTIPSAGGQLTLASTSVALPAGQSGWTATFSLAQAQFGLGDTVLLTGVMTSEDTDDPFVWQQALDVVAATAPASVG